MRLELPVSAPSGDNASGCTARTQHQPTSSPTRIVHPGIATHTLSRLRHRAPTPVARCCCVRMPPRAPCRQQPGDHFPASRTYCRPHGQCLGYLSATACATRKAARARARAVQLRSSQWHSGHCAPRPTWLSELQARSRPVQVWYALLRSAPVVRQKYAQSRRAHTYT